MGGHNSKQKGIKSKDIPKYGELYIQPNKGTYHEGEIISGKIFIRLTSEYPGGQLFISLKGKEYVAVIENDVLESTNHYKVFNRNTFVTHNAPAYTLRPFLPGHYVIPFSLAAPRNLPNSFEQKGNRFFASVRYQLKALLVASGDSSSRIQTKETIFVKRALTKIQENISMEASTNFGLSNGSQGFCKLRAHLNKNFFAPDEKPIVNIEFDNSQSKVNCEKVRVSLVQKLALKAWKQGEPKVIEYTRIAYVTSKVPAGSAVKQQSFRIELPRFYPESQICNWKENSQGILKMHGENRFFPITRSSLITSEYFIRICPIMSDSKTSSIEIIYPIEPNLPDYMLSLQKVWIECKDQLVYPLNEQTTTNPTIKEETGDMDHMNTTIN